MSTASTVTIMGVEDWIAVRDNPIQRDTERHAAKARHLLTPLAVHAIVWAAKLPSGQLIKLDGHTRALLWKRNIVARPSRIEVHVIPVQNAEEAATLYKTFDSAEALETTPDKVSGALRGMGYTPQSGLVSSGAFSHALRMAWTGVYGYAWDLRPKDVYEAINEFAAEVIFLDEMNLRKGQLNSGCVAAIMLTFRRHGDEVKTFWRAVLNNAGSKSNGRMDGVQAVNDILISKSTRKGTGHGYDILGRCLAAVEKYLAGEDMTGIPRPLDLTTYVQQKARPKYRLVRGKGVKPGAKTNGAPATA